MIRFLVLLSYVCGCLWSVAASARIFSFEDLRVAAFFRGTGGMHMMGQDAFSQSSGSSTYFESKDSPSFNYSGEIGLLFQMGDNFAARIGIEGLQTRQIEAPGYNGTGTHLMTVDSKIVAFVPNLTFDFNLSKTPTTKSFFFIGGGYVQVKGTNEYDLTTDGSTEYGGAADYKEVVSGTAFMGQAGLGFEFLFVDNATLTTEVGWRYLPISDLEYTQDVTTVTGAKSKGAKAVNNNGRARTYDMGGPFVGIALRFYIPPLN